MTNDALARRLAICKAIQGTKPRRHHRTLRGDLRRLERFLDEHWFATAGTLVFGCIVAALWLASKISSGG